MSVQDIPESQQLRRLIQSARAVGLLEGGREYTHLCRTLFKSLDFRGKNVLEIGCGKGLMCLWAKIQGANHVVGLEPMTDGCYDTPKCFQDFANMARELGLENTRMLPLKLEDYRPEIRFDIVLSLASINHLDEQSCIELQRTPAARESYVKIFTQLRELMNDGGTLFVADATNRSFYSDLKLRNPFNPHIEWMKHQPPQCWAEVLSDCGFGAPKISWLSQPLLKFIGIGTVPRAVSYFGSSAFQLQMQCLSSSSKAVRAA